MIPVNRAWLCVCLAWSALGAASLYLLDRSLVGDLVWLAAGVLLGCLGGAFLQRLERLLTAFARQDENFVPDVFLGVPVVGPMWGILVGPLAGAWAAFASGGPASLGAFKIGPVAVPALCQALSSPNPQVRKEAASALGEMGVKAKDAVPTLTNALRDSDLAVHFAAGEALKAIQRAKDAPGAGK